MRKESYHAYQEAKTKEKKRYCLIEDNNGNLYLDKKEKYDGDILYETNELILLYKKISQLDKESHKLQEIDYNTDFEIQGEQIVYGIDQGIIGEASIKSQFEWESEKINLTPYNKILIKSNIADQKINLNIVFDEIITHRIKKNEEILDVSNYNYGIIKVQSQNKDINLNDITIQGKRED